MLNSLGRGDSASRPRARILTKPLWALFFTNIFLFSSLNLLLTTMPLYLQDRGMSEGQIGFIFGGFYVACILMRLISGKFSRRLGEIRVLWIGLALTTLGNFLFLAFDSFINYFATRLLFGAGFGLATTLIISLASKIIPSHKLAEGLGYLAMGASLALAGGPMAGIKLNEIYGFKITMICVVTGLFLALLVTLTLRQKYFQINYVIPKAEKTKFSLPGKEITVPAFLTFLLGASCCGIFTYLVLYFDEMRLNGAGYFFLIATIGIVITRLLGGRIHDRFGHFFILVPSSVLIGLSLLILLFHPDKQDAFIAAMVFGLGMGAIFPSLQALIISNASPEKRTLAAAAFLNGYDIGIALSTIGLGIISEIFHTYRYVYLVTPIYIVVFLLVYNLSPALLKGKRL